MAIKTDSLGLYRELAERYDKLGQFSMRDRFLMLAASAAFEAGQTAEAERLRGQLLQQNRHHMLRPYRSFEEALGAADVQTYLGDLKANYPPDLAAQLLSSLKDGKAPPPASKPLSQRRPAVSLDQPSKSTPAIPPTAPVVDPYEPPAKPSRPSVEPYRFADEVSKTMPVPDLSGIPPRPLAQPLPGRTPPKPQAASGETERPPPRATVPVPQAKKTKQVPTPELAPLPLPQREENGGAWLCLLLSGVTVVAGIALAGFTLARPFLPPEWLP